MVQFGVIGVFWLYFAQGQCFGQDCFLIIQRATSIIRPAHNNASPSPRHQSSASFTFHQIYSFLLENYTFMYFIHLIYVCPPYTSTCFITQTFHLNRPVVSCWHCTVNITLSCPLSATSRRKAWQLKMRSVEYRGFSCRHLPPVVIFYWFTPNKSPALPSLFRTLAHAPPTLFNTLRNSAQLKGRGVLKCSRSVQNKFNNRGKQAHMHPGSQNMW